MGFFSDGPEFNKAWLLLPSLAAAYGGNQLVLVRELDGQVTFSFGNYLVRFTSIEGMVQVATNLDIDLPDADRTKLNGQGPWHPTFEHHFRDIIEAAVAYLTLSVYC